MRFEAFNLFVQRCFIELANVLNQFGRNRDQPVPVTIECVQMHTLEDL